MWSKRACILAQAIWLVSEREKIVLTLQEWEVLSLAKFCTAKPRLSLFIFPQDFWAIWHLSAHHQCMCLCSVTSNSFMTLWTTAFQAPLSMGFFQARILEWVSISSSKGSSRSRDQTCISCTGRRILHWATLGSLHHCTVKGKGTSIFTLPPKTKEIQKLTSLTWSLKFPALWFNPLPTDTYIWPSIWTLSNLISVHLHIRLGTN